VKDRPSREDVLLAVALGSRSQRERRVLPDRRTGLDRRKIADPIVSSERRVSERRQEPRRRGDPNPGGLLARLAWLTPKTKRSNPKDMA
jgi:hypothetical protein